MKISTIVVGLGKIGMLYDYKKKNHFNNHCQAIESHKNFNLIAAVDRDKEKFNKFLKIYKVPVFSSLKVAFEKMRPNLIIISTPTKKNDQLFSYIKKNNISPKIFLVEKPASYEYHNFKKFVDYCNTKKIRIVVNYQRSFSSSLSIMNTFLKKQKKIKIEVYYKKGFYNSCSHYINLFFELTRINRYKIFEVKLCRKMDKDFTVNCKIKIKYLLNFIYKKNTDEKIVIENQLKQKLIFFTEKSKIIFKKGGKSFIVKNNFNKNLKNVFDKITNEYKKKSHFNVKSSLKTLELITKVRKKIYIN